jgi:uncharacterized membrane protein YeaQ/YmgE (transglycosylase-associated protein family)
MYQEHMGMSFGLGVAFLIMIIIIVLATGALAGWIAGKITEGHGFGFWRNAGLGILGALVGSLILGLLGIHAFGDDKAVAIGHRRLKRHDRAVHNVHQPQP